MVVCCQSVNGPRTLTALLGAEIDQQADILIPPKYLAVTARIHFRL